MSHRTPAPRPCEGDDGIAFAERQMEHRKRRQVVGMLDDTTTRVLLATMGQDRPTVRSVAAEIGMSFGAIHEQLKRLRDLGLVDWRDGRHGTLHARVYVVGSFAPATARREPIDRQVRAFVIQRDQMVCGLCGEFVPANDIHLDHIIPWSRGGSDTADNLQVTHSACNIRKGNRS